MKSSSSWARSRKKAIPLNLYFKKGKVKVTVALVTGKKLYDKRQALAEKEAKRDIERRMKSRNY